MYVKNDHEMLIAFWCLCCKTTFLIDMIEPCLYAASKDRGKRRWRAYSAWTCPSWCKWFQRTSWILETGLILTYLFRFEFSYAAITCGYNAHDYRHQIPEQKLGENHNCTKIQRKETPCLRRPVRADLYIVTCLFAFLLHMTWMLYFGAFGWGSALVQFDRLCPSTFSAFVFWSMWICHCVSCFVLGPCQKLSTHRHLFWRNCHWYLGSSWRKTLARLSAVPVWKLHYFSNPTTRPSAKLRWKGGRTGIMLNFEHPALTRHCSAHLWTRWKPFAKTALD